MKNIIILPLLLISVHLSSQSYVDATGADRFASTRALDDFNSLKTSIETEEASLENIKGSMYLNSEFQNSTVILNGEKVEEKTFLRYNAFKDEIEIAKNANQKTASNILMKSPNVAALIGDQFYQLIEISKNNKKETTYMLELFSNEDHALYLNNKKKFVDEKPAPSGLGGSLPARFEDQQFLYHYSKSKQMLELVNINKKSIIKLFPDKQALLKKFIAEEKLKFKDYQDVLHVFNTFPIN
jgi:hypothetical protein